MEAIHVRLRPGRDDDIAQWYEVQPDKAEAVRQAIRTAMGLQNGATQETIVKDVVARELARLPDVVASTVREALSSYRLAPTGADNAISSIRAMLLEKKGGVEEVSA